MVIKRERRSKQAPKSRPSVVAALEKWCDLRIKSVVESLRNLRKVLRMSQMKQDVFTINTISNAVIAMFHSTYCWPEGLGSKSTVSP
jgi:hypothetical protein